MTSSRVAQTLVILMLLGIGALFRPVRGSVLVVLVALLALATVLRLRHRPFAAEMSLAAAIPAAAALVWGAAEPPVSLAGDCESPLAAVALWRVWELLTVTAALTLVIALRSMALRAVVPFALPSKRVAAGLVATTVIVAAGSLAIGPIVAQGWFGEFRLLFAPIALVPAVVFGLSNALAEEVAYRGVLRGGLVPALGSRVANVAQATIFALAHSGPDFVASPLPVMALMFAGAYVAGEIVVRTRSLIVPIALHAAFDLPIFLYWACRMT